MLIGDSPTRVINTSVTNTPQTPAGAVRVGTAATKFRDEFLTYNTVDNWREVKVGTGQTISVNGVSGSSRYLNINSGTTNGSDTILLSREKFKMPVKLVVGASMSQRIAGTTFDIGIVEVDDNGDIVTDTSVFSGPNCLDARNAALMSFYGTSTTNSYYVLRAQGVSEFASAAVSYGTTHMTAAGTSPNFFCPYQFELMARTELVNITSRAVNSTSAGTVVLNRTDYCPNPERTYSVLIRVRNTSIPASATDCRIHFVRVVDASAVSVDFGIVGGNTTSLMALPIISTGGSVNVASTSLSPSSNYGSTLYHYKISTNSTNATLVKTGSTNINDVVLCNTGAATVYWKLYNKATTAPTVGTDTPIRIVAVPAGQTVVLGFGTYGLRATLGFGYATTANAIHTDTTAIPADTFIINTSYT